MVVFQKAGGDNRYTFGNTKVAVRLVYLVKAIDQSFDSDVAEGIMDDVETDLHDADLSVTGYNTANCRRQRDLPSYSEVVDGKPYQYEGAYYEIELTPSA